MFFFSSKKCINKKILNFLLFLENSIKKKKTRVSENLKNKIHTTKALKDFVSLL